MRLVNRPLAFILAAALIAASIVVVAEVIGFAAHRSPLLVHWTTWYHWARQTRWDAFVVRVWSGILIAVGLLTLALQLKPPRVTRLPLRSSDDATDAAVTRRGLAGILHTAATGVDGISSATVKIRRRRASITASSAARGRPAATALTEPVTQAVRGRLDSLNLHHPPHLKVHIIPRGRLCTPTVPTESCWPWQACSSWPRAGPRWPPRPACSAQRFLAGFCWITRPAVT
jgi:hypothetical protein